MKTNEELYEQAIKAIQKLFYDTSVNKEKTEENLNGLSDEIYNFKDSLKD